MPAASGTTAVAAGMAVAAVVMVAVSIGIPGAQAVVSAPAVAALEALYNATNGVWWANATSNPLATGSAWLSGADPCAWMGVQCNSNISPDPM